MARKSRRTRRLRVVNPDCAGIDIGKDRHFDGRLKKLIYVQSWGSSIGAEQHPIWPLNNSVSGEPPPEA